MWWQVLTSGNAVTQSQNTVGSMWVAWLMVRPTSCGLLPLVVLATVMTSPPSLCESWSAYHKVSQLHQSWRNIRHKTAFLAPNCQLDSSTPQSFWHTVVLLWSLSKTGTVVGLAWATATADFDYRLGLSLFCWDFVMMAYTCTQINPLRSVKVTEMNETIIEWTEKQIAAADGFYYAQKQLLLSVRLSHRNSVCLSVCHTGGSVKNGAR